MRALVIEDQDDIAALVVETLRRAGFAVDRARTGREGLELARSRRPDLITLDLSLPDFDGVEVCRQIRVYSDCYLIMLTGRDSEVDLLVGLGVGADDFMTKPFSPRELRARVTTLLRRPRSSAALGTRGTPGTPGTSNAPPDRIDGGAGMLIDSAARTVRIADNIVDLTHTEFELLGHLARHSGSVCDRDSLVAAVWRSQTIGDGHLINVHIGNLRRKLRAHTRTEWIRTVRGIGYRFDASP